MFASISDTADTTGVTISATKQIMTETGSDRARRRSRNVSHIIIGNGSRWKPKHFVATNVASLRSATSTVAGTYSDVLWPGVATTCTARMSGSLSSRPYPLDVAT